MLLLLWMFIVGLECWELDDFVISRKMVDQINNDPDSTWKAGVNSVFAGKRYRDIGHLFNFRRFSPEYERLRSLESSETVTEGKNNRTFPDYYDVYKAHPDCTFPVRDQGQCGSDYGISPVEVMTDRMCIKSSGKVKTILSFQDIVSCSKSYGCQGGYIDKTWDYLVSDGVVSEDCFPYMSGYGHVPPCPYKCQDSENFNTTKHKISSWKRLKTIDEAMAELMDHGSIQSFFQGYQDFFSYQGGVYQHKSGGICGEHLIKIQGWGVDSVSGLPYWNCQNQWGENWGLKGYVWVLRGTDECGIEDNFITAYPILPK